MLEVSVHVVSANVALASLVVSPQVIYLSCAGHWGHLDSAISLAISVHVHEVLVCSDRHMVIAVSSEEVASVVSPVIVYLGLGPEVD